MSPLKKTFPRILRRVSIAVLAALVLAFAAINLLALAEPSALPAPARSTVTVISDVNVVDPRDGGSIAYGQMVVVAGNSIAFVGPNGSRTIPEGARVIPA